MRIIFLLVVSFLVLVKVNAQEVLFQLDSDGELLQTSTYKYTSILDVRANQTSLGVIYDSSGLRHIANIQGTLDQQILSLFSEKLVVSGSPIYNIQVKIYSVELNEHLNAETNLYEGSIKLELGYFIEGVSDPIKLFDYTGSLTYRRSANNYSRVKEVFNKVFYNAMNYFDDWIIAHQFNNPSLAHKVTLKIIDPIRAPKTDTVFYDPKRPLVWDDFKTSPSPGSRFNASIFSSFSIEGNAEIQDGELIQNVEFKVYMLPQQSWVRSPSDYGIAHEQLHFDLVRIAVDRMILKLKDMELEREFYDAKLHTAFLDAMRELGKLQEAYDAETRHGTDTGIQAKWKNWIEKGLEGDYKELERLK